MTNIVTVTHNIHNCIDCPYMDADRLVGWTCSKSNGKQLDFDDDDDCTWETISIPDWCELLKQPKLNYVVGDATEPQGEGKKLILHVCNNKGKWGSGFVLALSNKWDLPEISYRRWFENSTPGFTTPENVNSPPFELGRIQIVEVEDDIAVCNMIGQHDVYPINGIPPVRYDRIRQCLTRVADFAKEHGYSIHAPRFGAGLAQGSWEVIEALINENLISQGLDVTIYNLEE